MATRSTVHFTNDTETFIVYVHHDGYLEGRGRELLEFVERIKEMLAPTRGFNPSETAPRFIAFMFEKYQLELAGVRDRPRDWLETFSVKLVNEDPGDIEFRYYVRPGGVVTYDTYSGERSVADALINAENTLANG